MPMAMLMPMLMQTVSMPIASTNHLTLLQLVESVQMAVQAGAQRVQRVSSST
jgi:hypothetical protein